MVTGAAGRIGNILWERLGEEWNLAGIDLRSTPDPRIVEADMLDLDVVSGLMAGVDAVVHLGARSHPSTTWKELREPNIEGTRAVLEAARQAGLRRVVFASSNHVTGMYEHDMPFKAILGGDRAGLDPGRLDRITHEWPIRPDSPYGISKAFGEALGRYYAEVFGLEVICVRIGTVNRENRPRSPRERATLLTHADLAALIDACLRVERVPYSVLYGVSANTWRIWDLEAPRRVLGWVPRENAEELRMAE